MLTNITDIHPGMVGLGLKDKKFSALALSPGLGLATQRLGLVASGDSGLVPCSLVKTTKFLTGKLPLI